MVLTGKKLPLRTWVADIYVETIDCDSTNDTIINVTGMTGMLDAANFV